MRIGLIATILLLIASVPTEAIAQTGGFVGTWQIRKSFVTGKSNIIVNIVQSGASLGGTVVLVNPDRSAITETIIKPSIEGNTFRFEILLDNDPLYWALTLGKSKRTGRLKGKMHEMLIEEKVTKEVHAHPATEITAPIPLPLRKG